MNNLINKLKNKIENQKKSNQELKKILEQNNIINNLNPLQTLPNNTCDGKIQKIIEECPDLNKEKAIIINKLIPLNEPYLAIMYAKEILSNKEYWLIPTNKYLWIINEKSFKTIPYNEITICKIIKNNIMSKTINLNNIALEINGNNNKINLFIEILNSINSRDNITNNKIKYLCGITPIYQLINKINSGISLDSNNNIVFHTNKFNYKYNYQDILNYQLLIDNNPIISKEQNTRKNITSMQTSCYTISIKIITNNLSFTIPILESNALGKKYNFTDSIYINNMNFAKEIINKLNSLKTN